MASDVMASDVMAADVVETDAAATDGAADGSPEQVSRAPRGATQGAREVETVSRFGP